MLNNPGPALIVVFEQFISESAAEAAMRKIPHQCSLGADSSRGKAYWDGTGAKFIVKLLPDDDAELLKQQYRALSGIHEVYDADWEIRKD